MENYLCPLINKEISTGYCYDIVMVSYGMIVPGAIEDKIPENASEICEQCPFNQLLTYQTKESLEEDKKESIYQNIKRMAEKYPGLPYTFQNAELAGARDVHYILLENKLTVSAKEFLTLELTELVMAGLHDPTADQLLLNTLEESPLFLYLTSLTDRIRLLLAENLIDREKLYAFALRLATESHHEEKVKLGILLLGFFDNDPVRKIIKTLGYHSAFTIYAVEAAKNFSDYNDYVFHLAQNTRGFGKLAALAYFQPVRSKQQLWMFEYGAVNEIVPNMSAIICLEKADMRKFYEGLELTKNNYQKLSYILAHASENNDIKVFSQSLKIVGKYINTANLYARTFIDLAAIIIIKASMRPYWHVHGEDIEKENGWSSNRESNIRSMCVELIKQEKWKGIVLEELNQPRFQTSLIISVLRKYEFKPVFDTLMPLLERDPFDMDVLKYVLIDHADFYLHEALTYLSKHLPEATLREDPQDILEEDISPKFKPDIWLVYLLKALRKERCNEEALFIKCITSRFPDVRIEAINALRTFKNSWSPAVLPALEHACNIEPVKGIVKRLQRLTGKTTHGHEKEQRYVETANIKVEPSMWGISLFNTKIAGTYYRDLFVMEGKIEKGDVLYLMREPDNIYDSKAILITSDDGYVLGYVPRSDNSIAASMMDAGERLYAVFKSDSLENTKPDIQIMLSKRPIKDGKVIKFPLAVTNNIEDLEEI